jgi:hypothetical protein
MDAKAEIQTDAFNALIKDRLAFDRSVGTKLMAIAAKAHPLCTRAGRGGNPQHSARTWSSIRKL